MYTLVKLDEVVHEAFSLSENVELEDVRNCFEELQNLLSSRMPFIESLHNNNSSNTRIIHSPQLHYDGNISLLELDAPKETAAYSLMDVLNELMNSKKSVDVILTKSKSELLDSTTTSFSGDITVNGDVYFQELVINDLNVDSLNNQKIQLKDVLAPGIDQVFPMPLQAKTIFLDNLEIPSLCGVDADCELLYVFFSSNF